MINQQSLNHGLNRLTDYTDKSEVESVQSFNSSSSVVQTLPPGYKQTEVGIIPDDWEVQRVGVICDFIVPGRNKPKIFSGDIPWITTPDIEDGKGVSESRSGLFVSPAEAKSVGSKIVPAGAVIMSCVGELGIVALVQKNIVINQQLHAFIPSSVVDATFLLNALKAQKGYMVGLSTMTAVPYLNKDNCNSIPILLPPLPEQQAIATALSDVDALITALDKLIAKKRDIKQAAMQELLTGKRRLPGFTGEWVMRTLESVTDCLDNFRVPLNETQRNNTKGDIPYCGTNGILDYVDGYVIDDDIILMAEDGGYFDEYAERPIAYRMSGKCWVNNHAHILKAKEGTDQGFVFYSLVHKNIMPFLANGTRAKLNKAEMYKIEISIPESNKEQSAIVAILTDMDTDLTALEQKRDKTRLLKQGMMQELLTGRIRLA